MVDSPASHLKKNEAYEVAVRDEESLISIIEEAEAYGADYLVLEVNESTLAKGFLKDVPFDVRVLTNLNPKHNLEQYSEEQYVELKKSFFKDIEDDCKCVIGFQDYDKELLDELLKVNKYPKFICASNYIATVKGIESEKVTCLLTGLDTDITGMKLQFKMNGNTHKLETNLIMSYNALNILTALTTLEVLDVLDVNKFEQSLEKLVIPGRAEVYRVNGRLIVVDTHLPAMLDCLKVLKEQGKVNKIKVVVGSMGYGYKHWEERFKTQEFASQRKEVRKYAKDDIIIVGYYNPIPFLFNTSGNDLDELFAYIDDEYNKIANNNNCRYLSMYQLFKKNTNFLPNPADIHPNLDGYQEMANQIYSFYRGK